MTKLSFVSTVNTDPPPRAKLKFAQILEGKHSVQLSSSVPLEQKNPIFLTICSHSYRLLISKSKGPVIVCPGPALWSCSQIDAVKVLTIKFIKILRLNVWMYYIVFTSLSTKRIALLHIQQNGVQFYCLMNRNLINSS